MNLQEAFDQLTEQENNTANVNLKKKADITESTPGDVEFKKLVDSSTFNKGVKVTTGKYLSEDDNVVFTITATKDYMDDFSDRFELEEEEPDVEDDGEGGYCYSGGGYSIYHQPDEDELAEALYEDVVLDETCFCGSVSGDFGDVVGEAPNQENNLILVDTDFSAGIDITADVVSPYQPATYWDPAEEAEIEYDGDCSATVTFYFIFKQAGNSEAEDV